MENRVQVHPVGSPDVNDVRLQYLPVRLEPVHPLLHHRPCFRSVVKSGAAIAGLSAVAEVVGEVESVVGQMLVQRFDRRGR